MAFYDRFVADAPLRAWLLYGHLFFNSLVIVLMHLQTARTGDGPHRRGHQLLGRVNFVLLTLGVGYAVWLASEHGAVPQYGGLLAGYGFYAMSVFVYGTAVMGVVAIRSGDRAGHRISVAILICIWFSAPLGLLVAEGIRRRIDAGRPAIQASTDAGNRPSGIASAG